MKSGMIVELKNMGKVQVIGETDRGVFVDVWGIGIASTSKALMKPSGALLVDILKACKRDDNERVIEKAKEIQNCQGDRLQWIKDAQEKYIGGIVDVNV